MASDADPPFEQLQFFSQRHRPRRMPIAHWHSQVELNHLGQGRMTYLINGNLVSLPARRMAVFWGATPHQVIEQEWDSDLVVIYLPLREFLSLRLPDDFRRRLMGGAFLVDEAEDPADVFLFPRWHRDLATGRRDLRELTRHELGCRLWRLAVTGYRLMRGIDVVAKPAALTRNPSLERVREMAVFIAEHCTRRLTVAEIARAAEIHPNYAMPLFRRVVGMTIADYLTRQRLSRAQSLLVDTDLPVSTIARDSGFGSISRFYEVFGAWVGNSPSRYRAELAKAVRLPTGLGVRRSA